MVTDEEEEDPLAFSSLQRRKSQLLANAKRSVRILLLKSIHVHLSPGSSCGLVAYTLCILAQWSLWDIQLSFDW